MHHQQLPQCWPVWAILCHISKFGSKVACITFGKAEHVNAVEGRTFGCGWHWCARLLCAIVLIHVAVDSMLLQFPDTGTMQWTCTGGSHRGKWTLWRKGRLCQSIMQITLQFFFLFSLSPLSLSLSLSLFFFFFKFACSTELSFLSLSSLSLSFFFFFLQASVGRKEKLKAPRSVHKTKCVDVPHLDALFKLVLSHEPDHVGHRGCKQNIVSAETIHVNNLEAPKRLYKMSINLCPFLQTPHKGRPLHKRGHNQSLSSRSTLSLLSKAAQTQNQLQCFTATHKDKQRDICHYHPWTAVFPISITGNHKGKQRDMSPSSSHCNILYQHQCYPLQLTQSPMSLSPSSIHCNISNQHQCYPLQLTQWFMSLPSAIFHVSITTTHKGKQRDTCHYHPVTTVFYISITATHNS